MSPSNGAPVIHMPSGLTTFQLQDGRAFQLDLVEATRKIGELAREFAEKPGFLHLDAFAAWVKEKGGPALNHSQADWLWDWVDGEYLREKKARRLPFEQSLPSSTESTPTG